MSQGIMAVGQIQQGRAEKKAADFNALVSEERGKQQERLIRRNTKRQLGKIRASVAKSGVRMEGSPLEVLAESAANAEVDALNARYNARIQAQVQRDTGKVRERQARYKAGASLLAAFNPTSMPGMGG